MQIFCNIISVFSVTFDQFNAFLLYKSINLSKKTHLNAVEIVHPKSNLLFNL